MLRLVSEQIPLAKPVVTDEMEEAVLEALRTEFFVLGDSVAAFEEAFADRVGVDHAVAVGSGTSALHLGLEALGIGPGDRVLTSPTSFIASANAILHAGAEPVFCDVDPGTKTIDPEAAREVDDVQAVIPVHIYGHPADLDAIADATGDVPVLEDACQAHGATRDGRPAGSLGDVGCFSFYSTKNMTVAGDGGMVTTDDTEVADRIRALRDCGRTGSGQHEVVGYTSRLNTINAAFGRVQLDHLDAWNEARRTAADRYRKRLADVDGVEVPEVTPDVEAVHHLFPVGVPDRDTVQSELADRGVQTGTHYPLPIHLQPPYRRRFGYEPGTFPVAEEWADRTLSLPIFPEITTEQVDRVVDALVDVVPEVAT